MAGNRVAVDGYSIESDIYTCLKRNNSIFVIASLSIVYK
jgi:hypothetical protein